MIIEILEVSETEIKIDNGIIIFNIKKSNFLEDLKYLHIKKRYPNSKLYKLIYNNYKVINCNTIEVSLSEGVVC